MFDMPTSWFILDIFVLIKTQGAYCPEKQETFLCHAQFHFRFCGYCTVQRWQCWYPSMVELHTKAKEKAKHSYGVHTLTCRISYSHLCIFIYCLVLFSLLFINILKYFMTSNQSFIFTYKINVQEQWNLIYIWFEHFWLTFV